MVADADRFYQQTVERGLFSQFYVAEDENHASVIPTTICSVFRFLKESKANQ